VIKRIPGNGIGLATPTVGHQVPQSVIAKLQFQYAPMGQFPFDLSQ
jgi:hypothetical protein